MTADRIANRRYKGTERFMTPNGYMMERDVYEVYSCYETVSDDGQVVAPGALLGLTYGTPTPCGHIVSGPNRKERRRREAEQRKLLGKGNKHLAKGMA